MNGTSSPQRPHECPNIKARISQRHGETGLTIWHKVGRTQSTKDHSLCTGDECLANDRISRSHGVTHRNLECDCACIGPDPQKLDRLFSNGSLPLVRLQRRGQHVLVELEAYEVGNSFIAISHAQSDGPSGEHGNVLPVCQLERLFECTTNLAHGSCAKEIANQDRVLIWIDTLCIPHREVKLDGVSNEAITAMQQVESLASAVLVVDSDICKLEQDTIHQEKRICIEYSSWGSRFWTLYEALQARRLFFQLRDAALELPELEKEDSSRHQLERHMLTYTDAKTLLRSHGANPSRIWRELKRLLVGRRVNFTRDAYAVFALMLDKPLLTAMHLCETSESTARMGDAELLDLYEKIIGQLQSIESVEQMTRE